MLLGECLGGALYTQDFLRLCRQVGFLDPRTLSSAEIEVCGPVACLWMCKGLAWPPGSAGCLLPAPWRCLLLPALLTLHTSTHPRPSPLTATPPLLLLSTWRHSGAGPRAA